MPSTRPSSADPSSRGAWQGGLWYQNLDTVDMPALVDVIGEKVAYYRREAQRLLALAASSPFEDAKRQFLGLAQQYEMLAEHAARRASRGL